MPSITTNMIRNDSPMKFMSSNEVAFLPSDQRAIML